MTNILNCKLRRYFNESFFFVQGKHCPSYSPLSETHINILYPINMYGHKMQSHVLIWMNNVESISKAFLLFSILSTQKYKNATQRPEKLCWRWR